MTYAELVARLEANEHEHTREALSRIRYRVLESQLARAQAKAEQERRLRYEHTLDENDELNRLRAENAQLRADNEALRRAVVVATPVERRPEPPPAPRSNVPLRRQAQRPLLDPAALAIMYRDPPDPAGRDRTIEEGEQEA